MGDSEKCRRRIAVIGGGIAGLAAAHRLTELAPQAQVTLFESSDRVGGVLRTVRQDGFLIEQSADSFITAIPNAVELCRRIGFADQLIPTNPQHSGAMVLARGKLQRVPESFVLMAPSRLGPFLRSPILSWRGKLRFLSERFIPARTSDDDESLASFVRRRFGDEAFERLVQPLVGGIYTADPEKLSLAATLPRFPQMERSHGSLIRAMRARQKTIASGVDAEAIAAGDRGARYSMFVAPREGMSSLVEAIASRLTKHCNRLNTKIEHIERAGPKWRIHSPTVPVGSGDESEFDAVILAHAAPVAARLLERASPALSSELAGIEYAGTAIVVLSYELGQFARPLESFGFVVPAIEHRKILSASFSSVKYPGRAPEGKVLIRVFIGGAMQRELLELGDERLRAIAEEELRDMLGVAGTPCLSQVFRWPAAMPQYHLGHVARLKRIRECLAQLPGLALAGNAYEGVGVPQCVRSGETAAERVWENLSQKNQSPGTAAPGL